MTERFRAPAGYYSVADVAAQRGTDHAAAWRWLSRNGGKHFRRFGGFRIISKERYRQLVSADYIDDKLARVQENQDNHEEHCREEFQRIDATLRQMASALARR
jgi:hypothetical protein